MNAAMLAWAGLWLASSVWALWAVLMLAKRARRILPRDNLDMDVCDCHELLGADPPCAACRAKPCNAYCKQEREF